jgi:GTPase SAR1 family protein
MSTPHLLLFGSPGAGKSSLLGALAQAAATQAAILKGELVQKSENLDRLQKNTYNGEVPTTPSLETYAIRLKPAEGQSATAEATLMDCSGIDALEMLKSDDPFTGANPMQKPILEADAILLLVDAAMPSRQLNDELKQFGNWLLQFHRTRGQRTEVGDLPVYLVLTKVDQLARKEDTFAMWMQRIEEGKRRLDERFREFLDDQGHGFGSIDLRIWATAIRRPQLADRPAKAQEPLGVAELFREGLEAAADFQDRRRLSQSRLQNVFVSLVALTVVLGLVLVGLAEYHPDKSGASLEERVHKALPPKDMSADKRVGGTLKKLEEKRAALAGILQDDAFRKLSDESQAQVVRHYQEVDQYLTLTDKARTDVKFPFMAKTEEEFTKHEKDLYAFVFPADWNETPLGKRVQQSRKEYARVREELKKEEGWLKGQIDASNKLLDQGIDLQARLRRKEKSATEQAEAWEISSRVHMSPKPRVLKSDQIPGVSGLTYEYLDKFQAIKSAQKEWESVKVRLRRVSANIQEELKGT